MAGEIEMTDEAAPTRALRMLAEEARRAQELRRLREQIQKEVEEAEEADKEPEPELNLAGRQRRQFFGAGIALLMAVAVVPYFAGSGAWQDSAPLRKLFDGGIEKTDSVLVQGPPDVELSMVAGQCTMVPGPLHQAFFDPFNQDVKLWGAEKDHVVCFPNAGEGDEITVDGFEESTSKAHFVMNTPNTTAGKFGFGEGIGVALRPDVETQALWPLMAGVETLGLRLNPQHPSRTFVLQTKDTVGQIRETPMVVIKQRERKARIDVQMVNETQGGCEIDKSLEEVGIPELRFVCRAREDEEGNLAPVVVFCATCLDAGMSITVTQTGRDESEDPLNEGPFEYPVPWTGFRAEIPHGKLGHIYKVKLDHWSGPIPHKAEQQGYEFAQINNRRLSTVGSQQHMQGQMEFKIAVVLGDAPVPFGEVKLPRLGFQKVSDVLAVLCKIGLALAALVLAASAYGLPIPVKALSPLISALAMAVQFCSILGQNDYMPPHIQSLFEPLDWIVPHAPVDALAWSLKTLGAVLVAHATAVIGFLLLNGKGSAQALPHGLLFGAWELRALNFVALPLAYSSSTLVYEGLVNSDGSALKAMWDLLRGGPVLVGLLSVAVYAAQQISKWFVDENVVKVEIPIAGTNHWVYVDRICDQLRAMPIAPGGCSFISDWPASLGWRFAPAVAFIEEMEYQGAPDRRSTKYGSWETIWYQGPWVQHKNQTESRTKQIARSTSAPLREDSIDNPNVRRGTSFEGAPKEQASPAIKMHKIEASTRFVYACNQGKQVCIAGLVGLPWADAAIPATSLRGMVRKTRGAVEMRAQVGQLSGPLTSGRLSACFDWSDRNPYRVSADIVLKTILGAYISLLPDESDLSSYFGVAHPILALACLALAGACLSYKGGAHTHLVYNLGLAASLLAISLTIGSVWLCDMRTVSMDTILLFLCLALMLILVPVCLTLWATVMMAIWSARIMIGARDEGQIHDKVLPKVALRWAQPAPKAPEVRNNYIGVWWNDDCDNPDIPFPDNLEAQPTSAEAVVLEVQQYQSNARKPLPEVKLPMVLHSCGVEHWQLKVPCPPTGPKALAVEAENARPQIPLPVGLITDSGAADGLDIRKAVPLAALITEEGGILLYEEEKHNGGVSWKEAVQRELKDVKENADKKMEKEVISKIEEFMPKRDRCNPCFRGSAEGDEPLQTIMAIEISRRSL